MLFGNVDRRLLRLGMPRFQSLKFWDLIVALPPLIPVAKGQAPRGMHGAQQWSPPIRCMRAGNRLPSLVLPRQENRNISITFYYYVKIKESHRVRCARWFRNVDWHILSLYTREFLGRDLHTGFVRLYTCQQRNPQTSTNRLNSMNKVGDQQTSRIIWIHGQTDRKTEDGDWPTDKQTHTLQKESR